MTVYEQAMYGYQNKAITKDDLFQSVRNGKLAPQEYQQICGEECPELPLETIRQMKIDELDRECNAEINDGFMWNGRLFGCDEMHDQINLEALKNNVALGLIPEGTLEYYIKGGECEPFTNADFMALYSTAMAFKTERIKTCKGLKAQAKIANAEELELITWVRLGQS